MTEHPPTMTDAELLDLSGRLERLRDEVSGSPAMYSHDNPLSALADMDYNALTTAKLAVDRLYRWRHWPNVNGGTSYLTPAPTLDAAPCQRCGDTLTNHDNRYCAACDDVLSGGHRVMS